MANNGKAAGSAATPATAAGGALLRLKGMRGFLEGEECMLQRGDEVVVGRSRGADLSIRRSTKFLERLDRHELAQSEAYRTVSRHHARIAFYRPDHIVIEDLSSNGTFVDGERVKGKFNLTDLAARARVLALGAVERIQIDLIT
jgi:pSer/pThr/pTyr-binding forkhead associated (FHA) protein